MLFGGVVFLPYGFSPQRLLGAHDGSAGARAAHAAIRIRRIVGRNFDPILTDCDQCAHEGHVAELLGYTVADGIADLEGRRIEVEFERTGFHDSIPPLVPQNREYYA